MKLALSIHRRRTISLSGKLLIAGLCAWVMGFSASVAASPQLATPPVIVPAAAASAQVPVAQQPLTIRQPIPPNIVLMLDDSGSMNWDVMPDWGSLPAPGGGNLADGWRQDNPDSELPLMDSNVNGVYYNPTVTYTPPPGASSTAYPASAFTAAPIDGFDPTSVKVDLSTYRGQLDSNSTSYAAGGSSVEYSVAVASSSATAVAAGGCPSGWGSSTRYPGYCSNNFGTPHPAHWISFSDNDKNYFYTTRCDSITDVYNYNGGTGKDTCTPGTGFFVYVTGPKTGPFVMHYVSAASGACADVELTSNCVDADSPGAAAILQNIANWFTYYHTRILLAKSGLMRAFSAMNPTYRLGFGSINNDNKAFIKTLKDGSGNDAYTYINSTYIADVAPFGNGSSGTQRANFWQWVTGISPTSSTPLRVALQAVGRYYQQKSPWESVNATTGDDEYLACRESYVILTTDGFWNGGSTSVGNADGTKGDKVPNPNGGSFTYSPHDPLQDGYSNTLADVAMNYWEMDLRTDIDNEVPTTGADPAFWQHMVTFTIGMGYTPSDTDGNPIDKDTIDGLFQWAQTGTKPASLSNWGGWPKPSGDGGGSINNIADLAHAGLDGHGGFYSATDPTSFIDGLTSALQRAQARTGTGASLAANSTKLETGAVTYQAFYHTAIWTGELKAFAIDPAGAISTTPSWNAAVAMPAATDRNIHTYVPAGTTWTAGSGSSVAFKNSGAATPPALTTAELNALGSDAASQASMIDYLRGDESQDQAHGGAYRSRMNASATGENVLGDIVDSQPVYVGAPDADTYAGETFTGSSAYAAFVSTNVARGGRLYVAANDGMLHSFDTSSGAETYAFLPASVITHGGVNSLGQIIGVSELADPKYGTDAEPHQFFNDGQLTVANAYFDGSWHTVLVGTTGLGLAEAVYALDVTDPSNIKFLWERSAWDGGGGSGYIGQMTGKPVIAQVANGQWAVLIGNGYNSANGVAALLQFDLSDGTLSVHTTTDTTTANGLAAPAVWIGDIANGVSTVAYAGDLHGQVWSFQLSKVIVSGGVSTITATPTSGGALLYTAKDGANKAQPITAGMLTGRDPDTGDQWIFFGTGRYLSGSDITDTQVQTWYGLIVQSTTAGLAVTSASTRANLAERNIIAQTAGSTITNPDGTTQSVVLPARVVSPPDDPDTASMDGKSGWYMDLVTPGPDADGNATDYKNPVAEGERMVLPVQFHGSRLIGTTRIPTSSDVCNPSGTGWIMAVDPFTGTNPRPEFFDINGDGKIDSGDMITVGGKSYAAAGVGFKSLPNSPTFVGNVAEVSFDNGTTSSISTSDEGNNFTRVSWREMVNP